MRAANREGIRRFPRRHVAALCLVLGAFSLPACAAIFVCGYHDGSTVFRNEPCGHLEVEAGRYMDTSPVRVVHDPCLYVTSDTCTPSLRSDGKCPDQKPYGCGKSKAAVAARGTVPAPAVGLPGVPAVAAEAKVPGPDVVATVPKGAKDLGDARPWFDCNVGTRPCPGAVATPRRR
jgi:hypothetical protein